jgi:hypothetical protein
MFVLPVIIGTVSGAPNALEKARAAAEMTRMTLRRNG